MSNIAGQPDEKTPGRLKNRSDEGGNDVTYCRVRRGDEGKKGQKANRSDVPAAKSSLGNFAEEDLASDDPAQDR